MTQNKLLTKEVIRHIFTSFGMTTVNTPNNTLLSKELLTPKTVKIKYDDNEEFTHSVFAGQLVLSKDSKFRAVIVNLSMDDIQEYCCVFRLDKLPLHGLRLRYDDEDIGAFKIYDEGNKSWMDASIGIQAMILGGIEKIISYGLLWETTSEFNDLYKIAVNLAALV